MNPYNYDLEKANAMLDEAGWIDTNGDGTRDKDGQELQFVWDTYTDSRYVETMIQCFKLTGRKSELVLKPT